MSVLYAVLGLLSCQSLSGYDLKKVMQSTPFMPWSGNNNQIYKALVELHERGYVTSDIHEQQHLPTKKIYAITTEGIEALREWTEVAPEAMELRKTFLVQLAWADLLSDEQLMQLLDQYERLLKDEYLIKQQQITRSMFQQGRTKREAILWKMINENILKSYEQELEWLNAVKEAFTNEEE